MISFVYILKFQISIFQISLSTVRECCCVHLQEWKWQQKHTTGPAPLGVDGCAFTVVGKRLVVYGGHCGHGACYHNSLHELSTTSLEWTVLAPSETERAPMKKHSCGIAVYNTDGLCVFGGYGLLTTGTHLTAQYENEATYTKVNNELATGYTNELHIFKSGEHLIVCCTCMYVYFKVLGRPLLM